jgi:D-lyxose ketol-isomerase
MKRSQINQIIKNALTFFKEQNFKLPPFAYYSLKDWHEKKTDCKEIFDLQLGWDITDFGSDNFYKKGLLLFTLRNGMLHSLKYPKPYAEKIMIVEEEQVTPMHYHKNKMEDIINRAGGNLIVEFNLTSGDTSALKGETDISLDGITRSLKPGDKLSLAPGESISMPPYLYHSVYANKGTSKVLVGEVSMVNDDNVDNFFQEETSRFSEIEEDETPLYLLCNEYHKFLD